MDCSSRPTSQPVLPPGFRFHPTDEELVVHYLKKRAASSPLPVPIITEIDLYKFDPWDLPAKANFGEHEWYFFSPRDRKYPNGTRPNRAAASGYWKATGTDKPILTCGGTQKVGVKKALVFYKGRPPKGIKTNWIMHEYRLTDGCVRPSTFTVRKSLRLDDWVLCRVYKKSNHTPRITGREREDSSCVEEVLAYLPDIEDPKLNILPRLGSFGGFMTEPDPFLDNFLKEGNSEADATSLVQEESSWAYRNSRSCMNLINASSNTRGTSVPPTGFFPKPESIEIDSGKFDLNSLKRAAPDCFRDEEHLLKRSFMMSFPQLTQKIPLQQQQQKAQSNVEGEMGSSFRFPFSDLRF